LRASKRPLVDEAPDGRGAEQYRRYEPPPHGERERNPREHDRRAAGHRMTHAGKGDVDDPFAVHAMVDAAKELSRNAWK
jgi:hypothetical protein